MNIQRTFKAVLAITLWLGFASPSWSEKTAEQEATTTNNPLMGSWKHSGTSCGLENPIVTIDARPHIIATYNPDGTATLEHNTKGCSTVTKSLYTIINDSSMEVENTAIEIDEDCYRDQFGQLMSEEVLNNMINDMINRTNIGIKKVSNYYINGNILYLEDPRPSPLCNNDSFYNVFYNTLEKQD